MYLFTFSTLLGATGGLLTAIFLKKLKIFQLHRVQETSVIILFAFMTYSVAEILELSSILSLLFCGIFMSQYAFFNLSFQAREESCIVAKLLSNIAEAFVFSYLGLTCLSVNHNSISITFILFIFFFIIIGRTAAIFILDMITRVIKPLGMSLTVQERVIVTVSGFIRGAISYGLAVSIKTDDQEVRDVLISTTLIMVFFTTIAIGGVLPFIFGYFKEKEPKDLKGGSILNSSIISNKYSINGIDGSFLETYSFERFESVEEANENLSNDKEMTIHCDSKDREINIKSKCRCNCCEPASLWKRIDDRFLKPFLIDDWPNVKKDHNEISSKIIDLFNYHQQRKLRNKELQVVLSNDTKRENLVHVGNKFSMN